MSRAHSTNSRGLAARPAVAERSFSAAARASLTAALLGLVSISLSSSSTARADTATPEGKADALSARAQTTPEARAAVDAVRKGCTYSEFSRIGPSPAVREKCNEAQRKAIALGRPAAMAALLALVPVPGDRKLGTRLFGGVRQLLDVVARIGDVSVAPTLAAMLPKDDGDAWIRVSYEGTLRQLTYASINETAPWEDPVDRTLASTAIAAWTAFFAAHPRLDRAALLEERLVEARAHIADPQINRAYLAAAFISRCPNTVEEGRAALGLLLRRDDLDVDQRAIIASTLHRLPASPTAPPAGPVAPAPQAPRAPAKILTI